MTTTEICDRLLAMASRAETDEEAVALLEARGLLQKNDADILFSKIRSVALENPHRSEEFKRFVRGVPAKGEFHHVFGSSGNLKSTDLLGVCEAHNVHAEKQNERIWLIAQIPAAIRNLLAYLIHLERSEDSIQNRVRLK